jgi:hypothetical protein
MATRKAADVAGALERKGFVEKPSSGKGRGQDHRRFVLVVDGKKSGVRTMLSRGYKELEDNMLGLMAREVRLSKREFLRLIDCPMDRAEYLEFLRDSKVL